MDSSKPIAIKPTDGPAGERRYAVHGGADLSFEQPSGWQKSYEEQAR